MVVVTTMLFKTTTGISMQFEKIQKLLEWGRQVGAEIPNGVHFEYDEIEGIRCVCDEQIESPVLAIPSDIIIRKELIPLVFPNMPFTEADSNTWLKFVLAKLMYDCRDEQTRELRQKFAVYLECLPTLVDSPLVWNPAELSLLEGTNLGNSLRDKLFVIWKEWFTAIQDCEFGNKDLITEDLRMFEHYSELSMEDIYQKIIIKTVDQTPSVWYSFPAFLWSHLIFLSRAFPEYVLNNGCERHQVMLLPIVDLLNHNHHAKVEWSSNGKNFSYKHLGSVERGTQLYNNYGGKGNEELLSGYGFVLKDNLCSSVALKIKLPHNSISEILAKEPSIQLLTLDDYTTYAFEKGPGIDDGQEAKTSDRIYREGVTYLISKNSEKSLENMLNLFAYLTKVSGERWDELAPRFKGLQSLRLALNQKLQQVDAMGNDKQAVFQYSIEPHRKQNAMIYREEQVSILKWAMSRLKSIEKQWLSENKSGLLTTKKIMKYDPGYLDQELPAIFGSNAQDNVASLSPHQFLVLWIIVKVTNDSFISKHSWVGDDYNDFISKSDDLNSTACDSEADYFHTVMLDKSGAHLGIGVRDVKAAYQFLTRNSFTRLASRDQETILVKR